VAGDERSENPDRAESRVAGDERSEDPDRSKSVDSFNRIAKERPSGIRA